MSKKVNFCVKCQKSTAELGVKCGAIRKISYILNIIFLLNLTTDKKVGLIVKSPGQMVHPTTYRRSNLSSVAFQCDNSDIGNCLLLNSLGINRFISSNKQLKKKLIEMRALTNDV